MYVPLLKLMKNITFSYDTLRKMIGGCNTTLLQHFADTVEIDYSVHPDIIHSLILILKAVSVTHS